MLLTINGCGFSLGFVCGVDALRVVVARVRRRAKQMDKACEYVHAQRKMRKQLFITRLSGKLVVLKVQATTISSLRFKGLYLQVHTQKRCCYHLLSQKRRFLAIHTSNTFVYVQPHFLPSSTRTGCVCWRYCEASSVGRTSQVNCQRPKLEGKRISCCSVSTYGYLCSART